MEEEKEEEEEGEEEDEGRNRRRRRTSVSPHFLLFTYNMLHDGCLGAVVECILSTMVLTVKVSQADTNWSVWKRYSTAVQLPWYSHVYNDTINFHGS